MLAPCTLSAGGGPVPLSPQQNQRISIAVGQKVSHPCPLCGVKAWGWGADLIVLQTQRFDTAAEPLGFGSLATALGQPPSPPPSILSQLAVLRSLAPVQPPPWYPLLPVVCNNCGNTVLLNVYILGIADIWPAIATSKMG